VKGIETFRADTGAALGRLPSLKEQHPEVGEILDFYGRVLERQLVLVDRGGIGSGPVAGIDWRVHAGLLRAFLDLCTEAPAAELARGAERLRGLDDGALAALVDSFLREKDAPPVERFILTGFLGGALALPAALADYDRREWLQKVCPVCGFPPVVSYLADEEEIEGGRFARCGVCHAEWYYGRATCLGCGNTNDHELHYYVPETVPAVITVQACSACGGYIKMVDTRQGRPRTPELDDVASMTLDLWVRDKGFHKVSPNLFGF
jgi:FdhE protein